MRQLSWLGRIGFVALALVLLPTEAHDGRLSGAVLCAAEEDEAACRPEVNSYCAYGGNAYADRTQRKE